MANKIPAQQAATSKPSQADFLRQLAHSFNEAIPHNSDLGIVTERLQPGVAQLRLPYRDDWLAEPQSGLIHTGVISSLADSSCGLAVFSQIGHRERVATLDLRLDYLRAATAPHDVSCRAKVVRQTSRVVFVTAHIFQRLSGELPVATAQAAFMRAGKRTTSARS